MNNNMPRKSLFIKEENDKRVQKIRSRFLGQDKPIDIDYTTMVNILIEIGDLILTNRKVSAEGINKVSTEDVINIVTKYSDICNDQLKKLLEKNEEE